MVRPQAHQDLSLKFKLFQRERVRNSSAFILQRLWRLHNSISNHYFVSPYVVVVQSAVRQSLIRRNDEYDCNSEYRSPVEQQEKVSSNLVCPKQIQNALVAIFNALGAAAAGASMITSTYSTIT